MTGEWSDDEVSKNNNRTHPVGLKKSNGLGIYDIYGNVSEWFWEVNFDKDLWPYRGCKNASWWNNIEENDIFDKHIRDATCGFTHVGFRVCRTF